MITTANMGLTKWDLDGDPYDHAQLAANFQAIDVHDHTIGRGVKIPSGGIADGAITTNLLGLGSVTTAEILDGTILPADLSTAFWDLAQPLGTLLTWWRPNGSVPDPETSSAGRWVLADGRTLTTANHDYDAAYGINTSITVLDARNHYLLGSVLSGGGSTPGVAPNIGGTVGSNTANLTHTHTVNPHTHGVPAHTHTISNDGVHNHGFLNTEYLGVPPEDLHWEIFFLPTSTSNTLFRSYAFYPGVLSNTPGGGPGQVSTGSLPMVSCLPHNHSGSTGANSLITDASSGATTASQSGQSAADIRPNSVGAAVFVKVKY